MSALANPNIVRVPPGTAHLQLRDGMLDQSLLRCTLLILLQFLNHEIVEFIPCQ